jgi:hypothetical protein
VLGVGSGADIGTASAVADFMKANGYQVVLNGAGMLVPAPEAPFTFDPAKNRLTVAPRAY